MKYRKYQSKLDDKLTVLEVFVLFEIFLLSSKFLAGHVLGVPTEAANDQKIVKNTLKVNNSQADEQWMGSKQRIWWHSCFIQNHKKNFKKILIV